jgi:LEA14-like dessication related protein
MTTSFFRYFSLLLIVISIEGCFIFKDLEFKGIESHKIEEVSLKNGLKLNLGVQLQNPNWFAIKAKGGEINVKANGINLGKFQISRSVKIPKKSDGIIEIGIESKFKNLLGGGLLSLVSMATKGGKLKIELEGYVHASAIGLSKKVKVSTTEYIGF